MRYTTIIDISEFPCYGNEKCRLLYLHLVLRADREGNVVASLRFLADQLGFTLSALRNALRQLLLDGLVTTEVTAQVATHETAHRATRQATRQATQPTTHLHVVKFNELRGVSDTPNDTSNDTSSDTRNGTRNGTPSDTQHKKIEYNNNKQEENSLSLTLTRDEEAFYLEENIGKIMAACALDEGAATQLLTQFIATCNATNTTHKDKDDAMSHAISWINKQPRRGSRKKIEPKKSDHELRVEQKQASEELSAKLEEEREKQRRAMASRIPEPSNMSAAELCDALISMHDGTKYAPPVMEMLEAAAKSIGMSLRSLYRMMFP